MMKPSTLGAWLKTVEERCAEQTERFVNKPYLAFRLALLCTVLVILTGGDALVSIGVGYDQLAQSTTWQFLQKQITAPLTAISGEDPFHHTSKMYYRLLPVYLGKVCWDCSLQQRMYFLVSLEYLAGFLFFFTAFRLLKPYCKSTLSVVWLLVGLSFTFLGKIFFWDTYAYFDAFALLFLLLSMKSKNPILIFLYMGMALWTDERAFIAAALVGGWWFLEDDFSSRPQAIFRPTPWPLAPQHWSILAAVSVSLLVRWILSVEFNRPSVTSLSQTLTEVKFVLFHERLIELIPLVSVASFESYWIYILGTLATLWLYRERWGLGLYLMALAASLGISFLVYDMTRSLMYAFPAIFIGIRIMANQLSSQTSQRVAFYVMVSAALFPTYYLSHYMWPFFIRILRFDL